MSERLDWSIIVHGGARPIPPEDRPAFEEGCRRAVRAGREILDGGGSAVRAVEAAIRVLEDDPTFNAGTGAVRNAAGGVQCDAAIMDGATLDVGAVGAVPGLRNPVAAAALLLREQPILLVGEGARRFALDRGAAPADPDVVGASDPADGPGVAGCDTVGCVALDRDGHLAAATSTGGLDGSAVGRVGDSPLPGCGLYADDEAGAVALSGTGEEIARVTLASRVLAALPGRTPEDAASTALRTLERVGGEAGVIAMDPAGRTGWAHTSPQFAVAWADAVSPLQARTARMTEGAQG
ncbi:MAG: asparaginase [Naasia sp.]|jgi:beta-aspartyl-peptidase (threonine type)|nr:asparaginase [Naasia sp.]